MKTKFRCYYRIRNKRYLAGRNSHHPLYMPYLVFWTIPWSEVLCRGRAVSEADWYSMYVLSHLGHDVYFSISNQWHNINEAKKETIQWWFHIRYSTIHYTKYIKLKHEERRRFLGPFSWVLLFDLNHPEIYSLETYLQKNKKTLPFGSYDQLF